MTEPTQTPSPPAGRFDAVLAQYASAAALVAAAQKVRDAGYRRWDCHSPFPVHGIDAAMGTRPTLLPWLVLGAGFLGAAVALAMQWWTNAVDYPYLISGKPLFSWQANVPVAFELIVLFSALTAFLGALALNNLPRWSHPVLRSERFRAATTDGFFLSIATADPQFDHNATVALLQSTDPLAVEFCPAEEPAGLPRPLLIALTLLLVAAVVPPLLIAKTRRVRADRPRLNLLSDMDYQAKFKAQAANAFFADGRAMRPPVAGTVAQGQLVADAGLVSGKRGNDWLVDFPLAPTEAMVRRGQVGFNVYCAPCHGLGGAGDGTTSKRAIRRGDPGWIPPLSLHAESVRAQPVGQLYHSITNGVRKMPAYGPQIAAEDRWAIVLYVRALQRSQNASVDDVPAALRQSLR